ncbi:MAG TPA: helix-turn-helix domain-containing protein [Polyangiaceae bacterium]
MIRRLPSPPLRPFVSLLWASGDSDSVATAPIERERVLPTGAMHLVFRVSSDPLRLFDDAGATAGYDAGHAIVGGARSSCYVRGVSAGSRSVGAMLHPGAALPLFGVSAGELAERHTRLDELWGSEAEAIRERLLALPILDAQLDCFEAVLLQRLPRVRGLHPAIAEALDRLVDGSDVRGVVSDSGYSHRHFIALFEGAVGLTPKRYARVLRFRSALARLAAEPSLTLAELALDAGYGDQAHFNRDFREMAGISPTEYRNAAPRFPHHVAALKHGPGR